VQMTLVSAPGLQAPSRNSQKRQCKRQTKSDRRPHVRTLWVKGSDMGDKVTTGHTGTATGKRGEVQPPRLFGTSATPKGSRGGNEKRGGRKPETEENIIVGN